MAQGGNNWNSFMQERPTRILLNALCSVICGFYGVGAVVDLVRPGDSAQMLMEQMGTTGYTVMTVARLLVMLWACIAFARSAVKVLQEKDDE